MIFSGFCGAAHRCLLRICYNEASADTLDACASKEGSMKAIMENKIKVENLVQEIEATQMETTQGGGLSIVNNLTHRNGVVVNGNGPQIKVWGDPHLSIIDDDWWIGVRH